MHITTVKHIYVDELPSTTSVSSTQSPNYCSRSEVKMKSNLYDTYHQSLAAYRHLKVKAQG